MAISNYSDLKSEIASWIGRDDLTSKIPTFISFAEHRINRELRIRAMETALDDTISSGVISVPSDYEALKHAYIDGSGVQWLQRKTAEWIYMNYPTRSSDSKPAYIAREGSNFIFGPYPDSGYTVKGIYYAKFDTLSDSNTTNWLIANAPDLLLFGGLVEANLYVKDADEASRWDTRFERIKKRLMDESEREDLSGSTLTVSAG